MHSHDDRKDLDLIRDARRGNEGAFTQLVRRHESAVYNFAYKVCRDEVKAQEAWQDTFVNVYRKLGQFDGKSKFTTWLYSIVTNNCLMKHRRRKIDAESISFDEPEALAEEPVTDRSGRKIQTLPSWRETPLDTVMKKEFRSHLERAIVKLPLEYRLVFTLRDIEGQGANDTARILKISVPAVKSRLRRARVFLRNQLNEYMTS